MGLAANCYSLLHLLRERLLQRNQNRMILLLIHLTIADLCVILVIIFLDILIIIIILIILAILSSSILPLRTSVSPRSVMVPLLHKAKTAKKKVQFIIFGNPALWLPPYHSSCGSQF